MAITQFEQDRINQVAGLHNQATEAMTGQLRQLENHVYALLGPSDSQMTRALQATYDNWFANVERTIIARTAELTDAMRVVAGQQQASDEENSAGVTSSVSAFLN